MNAMKKAVLCAETETLQHPEVLGLADENLAGQRWLATFTDPGEARSYIANAREATPQVWVAGSDRMDAINLAAAIRRDGGSPSLVAFQGSGSLYSRAHAAGIQEVLDRQAFAKRYGTCKQDALCARDARVDAVSRTPVVYPRPTEAAPQAVQGAPGQEGSAHRPGGAGASATVPLSPSSAPATAVSPAAASLQAAPSAAVASAAPRAQRQMTARGHVLTVVGAGGGTGKSTLAVMCACLAQRRGYRTVVLDADLQGGDVGCLMGAESPLSIEALIADASKADALDASGELPAVVCAPEAIERSEALAPRVKDACALLSERFEVVVVNTAPHWSDVQIDLIGMSSRVLFVLDQRPMSLRLCKRALELCARCGVASRSFVMALNRCDRHALFSSIDVSCSLSGAHAVELREGGRALSECLGAGEPLEAIEGGNPFCESVDELLDEIVPARGAVRERTRGRRFRFRGKGRR